MTAMEETELATPTLMRAARGTYARSIRAQLHAIGAADLPRNGPAVLVGIASGGDGNRPDLPGNLGVTKQAVSQLIETMVERGYLARSTDQDDRRRVSLEVTPRGREAVEAIVAGCDAVDAQLYERLPADKVEAMRAGLLALAQIKLSDTESGAGHPRLRRQLRKFSPIFPVSDLAAALAHYACLGFTTSAYEEGDEYGFADRDGCGLHLAAHHGHDPADHGTVAYLYVRDADALYAEWTKPGIGGRTTPVTDTPYLLREGAHTDLDGNVIRFGSFLDE
jgi:DNA-binding MarR family transcriptional regulator